MAAVEPFTSQWLWNHSPFQLEVATDSADLASPPHLRGRVLWGDDIEDEWFIVFLLLRLTRQFEQLIVSYVRRLLRRCTAASMALMRGLAFAPQCSG